MKIMFSTTSNTLIIFYISINFCIDGLSLISVIIPVLTSRTGDSEVNEESLILLEVITGLV
jgi:hypothetical protein